MIILGGNKINILYILYFNAPMGGLHENVYNSAKYMKKMGCNVTVMVKAGQFEQKLKSIGLSTIITNFEDLDSDIKLLENHENNFDIIHFHPGRARLVALEYGQKYDIPLIYTVHGKWHGQLNQFIDKVSMVITVSSGVSDYIKSTLNVSPEKFHVIPNGFDPELYSEVIKKKTNATLKIGYVTRFDEDKSFILEILKIINEYLSTFYKQKIQLYIIGSGTLKKDFIKFTDNQFKKSIHESIDLGWLQGKDLVNAYNNCDIIIAPGRSAIEAMALAKPVIAVGSKNYIGLIDESSWQYGVYNNFGGIGNQSKEHIFEKIIQDLNCLLNNENNIKKYGQLSNKIAYMIYNDNYIQSKLFNIYKLALSTKYL